MSSRSSGPFIYRGSGKKQSETADIAQKRCVKEACDIQYCLSKYQYQQHKCEEIINIWKNCCEIARSNISNNNSSDSNHQ